MTANVSMLTHSPASFPGSQSRYLPRCLIQAEKLTFSISQAEAGGRAEGHVQDVHVLRELEASTRTTAEQRQRLKGTFSVRMRHQRAGRQAMHMLAKPF